MKLAIPIHGDRISPMFDVARRFELWGFDRGRDATVVAHDLGHTDPVDKTRRLIEMGTTVLICGAISWPLERMLVSSKVRVIPNTCGSVKEVIAAFIAGNLTETSFLMPGCTGQRRCRHRRGNRRW
jgi:predicted Fe-Mo cluster-binding NifX family protein